MKSIFEINFLMFSLFILVIVLYFSKEIRNEGFDNTGALIQLASSEAFVMSPGTMDQLASTRVVSRHEQDINDQIYDNLTRQGIINMTESGYKGTDYASTGYEY
jgi:hypothetical protein